MFIGHYGPAALLKSATPHAPLWHFFIAVQFLDYLWAAFILSGVERGRVEPGFLEASALDLYFMPYTHSLAAAAGWSIVAGVAYARLINSNVGKRGGVMIGAAVFSHWLCDLVVHGQDLALYPGGAKVGLSLWSSLPLSQGLEAGLILVGAVAYALTSPARGSAGRIALLTLCAAMLAMMTYNIWAPPPPDIESVAISALAAYSALAALACWADKTRAAR